MLTPLERLAAADEARRCQRNRMHRSHLCGACERFGNCMGSFLDPFVVLQAVLRIQFAGKPFSSFEEPLRALRAAGSGR